jgi:ubiquinone/menaquinone biosynthesis C-methylase UbiE
VSDFGPIRIAGGDTATPLNLHKRIRLVAQTLQSTSPKLLDCGCGAGDYVAAFVEDYQIDAFGIEYSAQKVRQAHNRYVLKDRVLEGNLETIPFPTDHFDAVLLNEVLEHVPDESRVLGEIHRILKNSGCLIVFSPNRWFPFETHGVELKGSGRRVPPFVPLIPYIPSSVGKKVFNYWARNYWHGQLRDLVRHSGFNIERKTYVWQTFENISGSQPVWMRHLSPVLRMLAEGLEKTPFLRAFGVSQVLVARKASK